jgi:YggT family protein
VFSGLTLYMLLILLRWLGGAIGFETDYGRWRWIARITDPLINNVRRVLPNLGPMDFGPLVSLLLVWLVRTLVTAPLIQAAYGRGPV